MRKVHKGGFDVKNKPSFLLAVIIMLLVACTPRGTEPGTVGVSATSTTSPVQIDTQRLPSATLLPSTFTATLQPTVQIATPNATGTATTATEKEHQVQIAYIKHGDVALWTEGIGTAILTDNHDTVDVRISDDCEWIAFKRQDTEDASLQELWVVNTSGIPEPRVLVSYDDLQEITPANPDTSRLGAALLDFSWRPTTHTIAYSTYVLLEGPGSALNHDLRIVDVDTLEKTTLFDKGEGGIFYYSPDGSLIALSNPENISLVNADGSNLQPDVLTFPKIITYSEYEYHPHPIWASDSNSMRVTIPPHDPLGDPPQLTGLWSIPVDGTPAVQLGSIDAIGFAWPNNAFAPDLEHIIYVKQVEEASTYHRELHYANFDSTNDEIYDNDQSMEFVGWSPDSLHFIYAINRDVRKGLYLGGIAEQPVLIYAEPDEVLDIQWIDGERFAYLVNTGGHWELRISDLNGETRMLIDTIPDSSTVFDVNQ
jgi:hypothetical protein